MIKNCNGSERLLLPLTTHEISSSRLGSCTRAVKGDFAEWAAPNELWASDAEPSRDSSSVALVGFFWLYTKTQTWKRKLSEIGEIINSEECKQRESTGIVFQKDELEKMVYLQAALSESMRLYPPAPINLKEVEEDDVYPDGKRTRKGDIVFYHIFAMGRMESIWGKDCNEFRPERWIKDGQFVSSKHFKYTVFNGGPRFCVGQKFAYLQTEMLATSILLRYKVIVAEGQVFSPKITTALYMKYGLLVTFQPRQE
ncbi:hypothetical protein Nepgr_022606 [Nepenthes gracilis]|uniref:Cytochrome P450 n=1 Tax=Nepenthes gracilis TaxID=150966 RepID=A0AAD3T1A9_NEPGR|nr:hypothetical protein Nepgr_022606 [Nepenthes gracilis]